MFCDHRFFSKCSQLMAVERHFFFYDLWIIAPSLWAAHVSQCFHFHTHLAHVDVTGGHPNHLLRVMNPTLGTMRWHRVQVVDIRTHGTVINRHTDTQHYRHSTRWRNTWGPPPPHPRERWLNCESMQPLTQKLKLSVTFFKTQIGLGSYLKSSRLQTPVTLERWILEHQPAHITSSHPSSPNAVHVLSLSLSLSLFVFLVSREHLSSLTVSLVFN